MASISSDVDMSIAADAMTNESQVKRPKIRLQSGNVC